MTKKTPNKDKTKQTEQTHFARSLETRQATTVENKEKFLKIYLSRKGNVSGACKATKIGRATFYEWLEKDKEFAKKMHEVKGKLFDKVKSHLMKRIFSNYGITKDGVKVKLLADLKAITYFLDRYGAAEFDWGPNVKAELSGNVNATFIDEFDGKTIAEIRLVRQEITESLNLISGKDG